MGLFTSRRQEIDVRQLERIKDDIKNLQDRYATLLEKHTTLELAFNALRQRVYAWRRWEPKEPVAPEQTEKPALDKAAILAAHRNQSGR